MATQSLQAHHSSYGPHPRIAKMVEIEVFSVLCRLFNTERRCSSLVLLHPVPIVEDMDSPSSEDYVVLAPGRPEPLVSLHWEEPESNGLDVYR